MTGSDHPGVGIDRLPCWLCDLGQGSRSPDVPFIFSLQGGGSEKSHDSVKFSQGGGLNWGSEPREPEPRRPVLLSRRLTVMCEGPSGTQPLSRVPDTVVQG